MVNLAEEGFDQALRVTTTLDEGLVARKLGAVRFHLVAAPALLNRIGRPTLVADLAGAPFLAYSPVTSDGRIRFGKVSDAVDIRLLPVMQSGNETLILLAAREGMGFAMMPPGVEQLRARGVGMVAGKDRPPGQVPQKPAVDGSRPHATQRQRRLCRRHFAQHLGQR